jgi:flavodoxin
VKVLIAYYSRTGNNEKLVNELRPKLECDVEKIVDTVNRKGVWGWIKGGRDASRKKMSRIEPTAKDPGAYDVVVLAFPLWASLMPPATRMYIFENKSKFKKVALMSVSGSGKGNEKTIPDFESAVGKEAFARLMLKQAALKQGGYEKKLQEFSDSILKLAES